MWAYVQSSVELVCQVRGLCPKLSSADVPVSPKYPEHRAQSTGHREQRTEHRPVYMGTCSGSKNISDNRTDTRTCLRYPARSGLSLLDSSCIDAVETSDRQSSKLTWPKATFLPPQALELQSVCPREPRRKCLAPTTLASAWTRAPSHDTTVSR